MCAATAAISIVGRKRVPPVGAMTTCCRFSSETRPGRARPTPPIGVILGSLGVVPSPFNDPLFDAWIKAGKEASYAFTSDYNGAEQENFGRAQFTIKDGRRCSAANAFLKPVLSRQNLALITEAQAIHILFEGSKAIGLEYQQGGVARTIHADREVILCGGVFNSPHLFMLSGIEPAKRLRDHGIDVLHTCLVLAQTCKTTWPS